MALLATLHDHQRAAERQALDAGATLRVDGNPYDILIANISVSGCLFVCPKELEVGDRVTVGIGGLGRRGARIVRTLGLRVGAEFDTPLLPSELDNAAAVSDEGVVSLFPWPVVDRSVHLDDPPIISLETPRARLMIIVGLVAMTWAILITGVHAVK